MLGSFVRWRKREKLKNSQLVQSHGTKNHSCSSQQLLYPLEAVSSHFPTNAKHNHGSKKKKERLIGTYVCRNSKMLSYFRYDSTQTWAGLAQTVTGSNIEMAFATSANTRCAGKAWCLQLSCRSCSHLCQNRTQI